MTISDILGCAGPVILVLLASVWIPLFGPFLSLLTPLPFLFYLSKLGLKEGIKVCLIALLAVGIVARLLGEPRLVLLCLAFGLLGLILSELYKREYSYSRTIFSGTLLMLLVGAAFMLYENVTSGVFPVETVVSELKTGMNAGIAMSQKEGLNPERIDQVRKLFQVLIALIEKTYLFLAVFGTGFTVWLNVVLSKPLFRLKGIKYPDLGRSDMWSAPEFLVWVLIAAGFSKLLSITGLDFASTNTLLIISAIYVFHGLSIILFFFNKYNVPVLSRIIIYLIIVLQQFPVFLALLGLFDQWFDFRKINRKTRTTD